MESYGDSRSYGFLRFHQRRYPSHRQRNRAVAVSQSSLVTVPLAKNCTSDGPLLFLVDIFVPMMIAEMICMYNYILCTSLASQHLSRAESRPAPHQLMPCGRGVILKTQPPPQPRVQEAPKPRFSSGFIGIWVNFDHLPVWSVGWMRNCRPQFIHVGAIQSAGPRNFTLESTDQIQPDLLCG